MVTGHTHIEYMTLMSTNLVIYLQIHLILVSFSFQKNNANDCTPAIQLILKNKPSSKNCEPRTEN